MTRVVLELTQELDQNTVPITRRRLRHLNRQLDRILDFVASRGFPPVHDRSAGDSRDGLQQVGLWDVPVLA